MNQFLDDLNKRMLKQIIESNVKDASKTACGVIELPEIVEIAVLRNVDAGELVQAIELVRKDPRFLDLCCKALGQWKS